MSIHQEDRWQGRWGSNPTLVAVVSRHRNGQLRITNLDWRTSTQVASVPSGKRYQLFTGAMAREFILDDTPGGRETRLRAPLWFQIASRSLFLVAAVLLFLSLGTHLYGTKLVVADVAIMVLAQGSVGFLYASVWFAERRRVRDAQRELSSLFRHVLDGILILDDQGMCRDANPAAYAILGAPPAVLLGHSFAQFVTDRLRFERQWRAFLEERFQSGRTELVRHSGSRVVVRFTLTADYLPGRHAMILCDI